MKLNEYQDLASDTKIYNERTEEGRERVIPLINAMYCGLGLAGEAGEACDEIKKMVRNDRGVITEERREKLKLELGDVMWYTAALAAEFGFTLEEIAQANIEKLQARKNRGFGG